MKYIWDDEKNTINIKKHGIDFADVPEMFDYPMLTGLDTRKDYNEDRWIGIGMLRNIVAVIVFTEINENTIRIISARKATKNERAQYEKAIKY